jgi:RecB family endonuclease NucS
MQRLLRDRIAVLADGLLVLSDEFSGWVDSARRIDLLCLDAAANLVVVGLNRGDDGGPGAGPWSRRWWTGCLHPRRRAQIRHC